MTCLGATITTCAATGTTDALVVVVAAELTCWAVGFWPVECRTWTVVVSASMYFAIGSSSISGSGISVAVLFLLVEAFVTGAALVASTDTGVGVEAVTAAGMRAGDSGTTTVGCGTWTAATGAGAVAGRLVVSGAAVAGDVTACACATASGLEGVTGATSVAGVPVSAGRTVGTACVAAAGVAEAGTETGTVLTVVDGLRSVGSTAGVDTTAVEAGAMVWIAAMATITGATVEGGTAFSKGLLA
mmetsp:Transcript_31239/g.57126  ORF Transcript_31239/g.57126 Transcript_31239/m.57126 type:complete len:244 (-) Transcript_31239:429-1160(-)